MKLSLLGMAWLLHTQDWLLHTDSQQLWLPAPDQASSTSIMGGGGEPLAQELLAVIGCWGRRELLLFRHGHLWVAHVQVDGPTHMDGLIGLSGIQTDRQT